MLVRQPEHTEANEQHGIGRSWIGDLQDIFETAAQQRPCLSTNADSGSGSAATKSGTDADTAQQAQSPWEQHHGRVSAVGEDAPIIPLLAHISLQTPSSRRQHLSMAEVQPHQQAAGETHPNAQPWLREHGRFSGACAVLSAASSPAEAFSGQHDQQAPLQQQLADPGGSPPLVCPAQPNSPNRWLRQQHGDAVTAKYDSAVSPTAADSVRQASQQPDGMPAEATMDSARVTPLSIWQQQQQWQQQPPAQSGDTASVSAEDRPAAAAVGNSQQQHGRSASTAVEAMGTSAALTAADVKAVLSTPPDLQALKQQLLSERRARRQRSASLPGGVSPPLQLAQEAVQAAGANNWQPTAKAGSVPTDSQETVQRDGKTAGGTAELDSLSSRTISPPLPSLRESSPCSAGAAGSPSAPALRPDSASPAASPSSIATGAVTAPGAQPCSPLPPMSPGEGVLLCPNPISKVRIESIPTFSKHVQPQSSTLPCCSTSECWQL